jgi:hypothetical protein
MVLCQALELGVEEIPVKALVCLARSFVQSTGSISAVMEEWILHRLQTTGWFQSCRPVRPILTGPEMAAGSEAGSKTR